MPNWKFSITLAIVTAMLAVIGTVLVANKTMADSLADLANDSVAKCVGDGMANCHTEYIYNGVFITSLEVIGEEK